MTRDAEYFHDHLINPHNNGLRLAEHEVLLSFTNDGGAAAFHEWWGAKGKNSFLRYCEENVVELSEDYG